MRGNDIVAGSHAQQHTLPTSLRPAQQGVHQKWQKMSSQLDVYVSNDIL